MTTAPLHLWRRGWFVDCAPKSLFVRSSGGGFAAGKYYFEVTVGTWAANTASMACGICGATAALFNTVGVALNLAQANSAQADFISSQIISGGVDTAPGWGYPGRPAGISVGFHAGDTIAFAVDTVNHRVWWKNVTRASAWFGGTSGMQDPAGTVSAINGADFSATGVSPITGNVYIFVGGTNDGTNYAGGTINAGATAFAGTLPTGYFAWDAAVGSTILNSRDNSNLVISNNSLTFSCSNPITGSNSPVNGVRSTTSILQAV